MSILIEVHRVYNFHTRNPININIEIIVRKVQKNFQKKKF